MEQMVRQFSLHTDKDDIRIVEIMINKANETVPIYFKDRK